MPGELNRLEPAPENLKPSVAVFRPSPVAEARAVKLKAPEVALEPKMGALAETVDSGAVVSPLLAGDVIGEAPKTTPLEDAAGVAGLPKSPEEELVESAGLEKMFEASTLAGVEKIEEDDAASAFTVEKMDGVVDEASGFEELAGEKTDGAGAEKRLPAGLKGEDAEEPKREELAAVEEPPPKTEPPTGLDAPPNIELLVEPELLGVKENAALGVTA